MTALEPRPRLRPRYRCLLAVWITWLAAATPEAEAEVYMFVDQSGVVHFTDNPPHEGYARHRLKGQAARSGRTTRAWDGVIRIAGEAHGVSPALVKAVIHAESSFDPGAISPRGAQGLMQLMPDTAESLGVDDPFDPWQNIDAGTRYLGLLVSQYPGDLAMALAAYNAGPLAVRRFGGVPPYQETTVYVKRVLALYDRYHADFY
jgi:soluble lytic murein transglycosylase